MLFASLLNLPKQNKQPLQQIPQQVCIRRTLLWNDPRLQQNLMPNRLIDNF